MAEQFLSTYQGTTTEVLSFTHQDASGTGARLTDASGNPTQTGRTAEYDPMGRNIADASPYVTLNTLDDDGGEIDMFGSGQGYRPGRTTYTIDHQVVSESRFMDVINSGLYGGAFGLLEIAARMSAREVLGYTVNTKDGIYGFGNRNDALDFAARARVGTVDRWIAYNNWQVISSLIPIAQQRQTEPYTQTPLTVSQKEGLQNALKRFTSNEQCSRFITGLLEKLKSTGAAGYDTTDINKLFAQLLDNPVNKILQVNYLEIWEKGLARSAPYATTAFGSSAGQKLTTLRFDSMVFGFVQGTAFGRPFPYSESDAMAYLVHELAHAYGGRDRFTHRQMALYGADSARDLELLAGALPNEAEFIDPKTKKLDGAAFDQANSTFFTNLVKQVCGGAKK